MKNKTVNRIVVTQEQLAKAFTEWDRRYREEPDRFMSEAHHLLKETPKTYGQACAPYLVSILNETGVVVTAEQVMREPGFWERLGARFERFFEWDRTPRKGILPMNHDGLASANVPPRRMPTEPPNKVWMHFCKSYNDLNVAVPSGAKCPHCGDEEL